jgi:tyrosyl-tRNA synthetase
MIKLAAKYTVARMLEREDFAKRFPRQPAHRRPRASVPADAGLRLGRAQGRHRAGGTDQKFNLLVGRELQSDYGQEPQCILTMPLLEGLDGVEKMSKSKDNYIGITEARRRCSAS